MVEYWLKPAPDNLPKLTIWHLPPLHSVAGQLSGGEEVRRVWILLTSHRFSFCPFRMQSCERLPWETVWKYALLSPYVSNYHVQPLCTMAGFWNVSIKWNCFLSFTAVSFLMWRAKSHSQFIGITWCAVFHYGGCTLLQLTGNDQDYY